jgi:CheY-like chemotaxis protein
MSLRSSNISSNSHPPKAGDKTPVSSGVSLSESVAAVVSNISVSSDQIRVLLVDDTASIRKVTTHLLQRAGYHVTTATNGMDALDKLSKEVFDVVLMDLHMPVMDGIEAVKRLRAREDAAEKEAVAALALHDSPIPFAGSSPELKPSSIVDHDINYVNKTVLSVSCKETVHILPRNVVLALTANCTEGLDEEVKSVGFDDFLEKPLKMKCFEHILLLRFSKYNDHT